MFRGVIRPVKKVEITLSEYLHTVERAVGSSHRAYKRRVLKVFSINQLWVIFLFVVHEYIGA